MTTNSAIKKSPICIGIDLGTTNSLVSVFRNGRPLLIPNSHAEFLTPSVVGVLADGQIIVGRAARDLRVTSPESCVSCFKRFMGQDRKLDLGSRSFTPHELSSLVLRSLRGDAETFLGHEVSDAVITVPAYFNDHQRQATRLAGELAGLNVRRMINEPTAAALVYGFHNKEQEKTICVIDLGGGTFDVTVMEIFEGSLEIRSTAGESLLGGEDFTDRIVSSVLAHEAVHLELAEIQQPLRVSRLRGECERAKRSLIDEEIVTIRIPEADGMFSESPRQYQLSRSDFGELCQPLMNRLSHPIIKAIQDASLNPEKIDEVILVGGATRMPMLQSFLNEHFGKKPIMEHNPDEVVALGAAVQAALMSQDSAVEDMVMTDVCPHTLGIEIVKDFSGFVQDGFFAPVIHRNSTIPITREEIFTTVYPNQKEIKIRIFQGDARRVKDNIELGKLFITHLKPGPAGSPFRVRFSYDISGVLEVEAYVDGGKKFRTIITSHVKNLSSDQIEEAKARIAGLKFYPRESLEQQKLLKYSERIVGEVAPHSRQELSEAIDFFESTLIRNDGQNLDQARQALLAVLSTLGIEYGDELL